MTQEPKNPDMENLESDIDPQDGAQPDGAEASGDEGPTAHEVIEKLVAEVAEYKDKTLRAMAETENVRRRLEREREDTARYAISRFAGDLLSVADNLRRALDAVPAAAVEKDEFLAKLVDGVGATERTMLSVLDKNGVKKIDPTGEKFDPNFHEVLFEMDDASKPAGTVVQLLEAGYTIGGRLLRPARVAVAKGGPAS